MKKKGKHGGRRKGAGAKSILDGLTNAEKVITLLNEAAPAAVETLMRLMKSDNEMVAMRASAEILRKVIPDKKEISGSEDGAPLKIVIEHETVGK